MAEPAPVPVARVPLFRSLRLRLAVAFVVALVAMAASQAWVVSQQGPLRDSLRSVVEGYLPLSKQVTRLVQDQERVRRDLERLDRDRPRPADGVLGIYIAQMSDNLEIAEILARGLRARPGGEQEQAVITRSLAYLERIGTLQRKQDASFRVWTASPAEGAAEEAGRELRTVTQQLVAELDRLSRLLDERIVTLTAEVEQRQSRATAGAVALFSLTGGLALALLLASLVALRPIGHLTAEVQRLAAGSFGGRIEVRGRDEVGVLAEEFNAMAEAIAQRDRRLTERNEQLDVLSQHLTSVLDAIDDGLVVVEDGRVTLANPAARAVWGVQVGEGAPEALQEVLAPGRHGLEGQDGTRHAVTAAPLGDSGVVAVLRDVSEIVHAQEALARSERLALVGQMLAQITHEVRNPLNALSLNAELLAEELEAMGSGSGSEPWELLEMIRGEVARLTDVTGHYLQLARRPRAQPSPTSVVHAAKEVVRLLEPELEASGVTMDWQDPGPVPPQLVDGNQLRQALLNILRNAVEAGARRLSLSVEVDEGSVSVCLEDDGPGMTEAEVERATDPFYSTKASGTGLGLAIVRQIMEEHHGELTIDSGDEGGARVRLRWPRADVADRV